MLKVHNTVRIITISILCKTLQSINQTTQKVQYFVCVFKPKNLLYILWTEKSIFSLLLF